MGERPLRQLSRQALQREVLGLRQRILELEQAAGSSLSRAQIEHDLRERLKELECLYAISALREQHFQSADRFLQSVVECLPRSWQYPEYASARITIGDRQYVTADFREGPWRMAAEVRFDQKVQGLVEVFYGPQVPALPDGPFLAEEQPLIRAVAERVAGALLQMRTTAELEDAHRVLQRQHQALADTNTTLRVVLARLEEEKRDIRAAILANIQKIIMPIVFELELEVTGRQRSYVTLLRQSLQEIASPFMSLVARTHLALTPVEIAVAAMIRNGLSTKEIAQLRCISPATVRRHRENIRRKLGLRNRKANLVSYLQHTPAGEEAPGRAEAVPAAAPSALRPA
jgi:DNA-binding CsgD family transcriptional regulator